MLSTCLLISNPQSAPLSRQSLVKAPNSPNPSDTMGTNTFTSASISNQSIPPNWPAWNARISNIPVQQAGCFVAAYPSTVWEQIQCVPAPSIPLRPSPATVGGASSAAVGNGNDEVAHAPSGTLIGSSIGSFQTSGLTSETDNMFGANAYGLQVNSQTFATSTTPYTGGHPLTCVFPFYVCGWEQFVYVTDPGGQYVTATYIQYWLINYYTAYGVCPSTAPPGGGFNGVPWANSGGSCVSNSPGTSTPLEAATNLSSLNLRGYANFGNSNDEVMFCISGGNCYAVSITEQVLNLYQNWQYSEFNVFGYGALSQANFNSGTTITVTNTLKDQSGNVIIPSCVNTGYTGETNNLNLGSCSSNGNGQIVFTESNLSPVVVSTDKSTYTQGDFLQYTGTGLTPYGSVYACLSTDNDGSLLCTSTTADVNGNIAGSMQVGTNIPAGPQKFMAEDISTSRFSNSVQLTILTLTVTTTTTSYSTSTFTTFTTTSSTSTFRTATTTTSTSISTSTVVQICSATSTTQTTSTIVQATVTSSTTSTTTTRTSTTSTFLTTTSSTSTSTSVTTTTTTVTVCTQTSTSTSTSTIFTTFTRPSTVISLALTPNSITVGSSLTLSGSITPSLGAVAVSISFSRDSGSTWIMLMSLMTDNTGSYSTSWTPPYPSNYLLEASWSGNSQLAGSTSSPASLTVTGSVQPTPTVLLYAPSTASRGQTVTMSITVFNPTSSPLNANVTVQITGPSNYVSFDVIQIQVGASSQLTTYYDWTVPNQSGAYSVTVGLLQARPGGIDTGTIQPVTGTIQVT